MIPSTPSLLEANDLTWVADVVDSVTASRGQPWRVALERVDAVQQQLLPTDHPAPSAKKFSAVVGAIQRVIGGRMKNAHLARTCRALVLGRAALTNDDREDRIAAAARALNISCLAVELALWADLPRERPVELPHGRPNELEIAAFANVQLIQSAVRKAQRVTIDIVGDASAILRGAAARGLLVSAIATPTPTDDGLAGDTVVGGPTAPRLDETRLDAATVRAEIEGPIALCHRTAVYGRALASLVPLLAECDQWTLTLSSSGFAGDYSTQFSSPALLPVVPASVSGPTHVVARLARELRIALAAEAPPRRPAGPAVMVRRNGAVIVGTTASRRSSVAGPTIGKATAEAAMLPTAVDALSPSASHVEARVVLAPHSMSVDERVVVAPPPIAAGAAYLCPDIVVDDTCIEVVGFWTRNYLDRKLAAYAAAGRRVVLCVDELRGCADDDLPSSVVGFTKHIDVDAVLRKLRGAC